MYVKNILFLVCFLSLFLSYSQKGYWGEVNKQDIKISSTEILNQNFDVHQSSFYQLHKTEVIQLLKDAPNRLSATSSNVVLDLPNHLGVIETYEMFKVNTLSPELALKYPEIMSFVGRVVGRKDASVVRITITPQGFYAVISKPNVGQYFINPYDKNGQYYISFLKSDISKFSNFNCSVNHDEDHEIMGKHDYGMETFNVNDSTLRTYDLAVSCTGEYSQYHINQANLGGASADEQISAVLSAITVSIDRVNSIYERDLGVTFQLIPNVDELIFLNGSNDPFTNNDTFSMLNQNQNTIDLIIGSSNYDIGHIFSTSEGGVASLESVCVNNFKARGVTGLSNPVGDPYDIDYVSHEIGHQFGATHTQNNNCQRSSISSLEPGSGSTIMGYAGICPPNIQNNSDAHFHQISIDQMYSFISTSIGGFCSTNTSISNVAPVVGSLPNYIIPNGTPFYLEASATDNDGDALTYNWEQFDTEISFQPPSPSSSIGPNFRSLPSKSDPRRYFPDFNTVLNNNYANNIWEVLPNILRNMNFVVTVRDNNILGGQSSVESTLVTFASVGPFEVTSQNTIGINWVPGETETITWSVAGTTSNGINTSNVNILLSTDGGLNFDTVLASNTPNDGSESITVPQLQAGFCRIMVEPVDNIYYAINTIDFAIDTDVTFECQDYVNNTTVNIPDGAGNNQQGDAVSSTINIPDNIQNITDINISLNVSHSYVSDLLFQLQSPSNELMLIWGRNCSDEDGFNIVFNDNGQQLPEQNSPCDNPLVGTYSPIDPELTFADLFANGTSGDWVLQFADFFNGDIGTLDSWEIEVCYTLSVEDNNIGQFSIVPNPNNGIFNLNFEQILSSNSTIRIFDIQGRLIENINYDPNAISQSIQLKEQYSSGVYLLEVSDDRTKSVKKLILK